jgi:hypothetical protein
LQLLAFSGSHAPQALPPVPHWVVDGDATHEPPLQQPLAHVDALQP